MHLENANHPKNKPVLHFTEGELAMCAIMNHDEAKHFLAKIAFSSELPAFNAYTVVTDPEYIPVRVGMLDPRISIAHALQDRDRASRLLSKYDAALTFETSEVTV